MKRNATETIIVLKPSQRRTKARVFLRPDTTVGSQGFTVFVVRCREYAPARTLHLPVQAGNPAVSHQ